MRILSVKATDFRAYPTLDWSLPGYGLYMIDAITDTGRSNMAGKSTLLDSIFWGLFGWLPKWHGPKGGPVDAVIRRNTTRCQVEVVFEHNGSTIRVIRQRPNKLQVYQDYKEIHGKSSDLDKRIEILLGMSAQQFLLSVYIAQDRSTSFFTMTDGERTQLLSLIAGLEELDRGLELAKQKKDQIQASLNKAEGALNVLKEQINVFPTQKTLYLDRFESKKSEVDHSDKNLQEAIIEAEGRKNLCINEHDSEIVRLQSGRDAKLKELQKQRENQSVTLSSLHLGSDVAKLEPSYYAAVSEIQEKITEINSHNKEQEKIRIRNYQRVEKINKALDNAERAAQGKCSTCKQELPQWDREAHAQKFLEQAHALQEEIEIEGDLMDKAGLEALLNQAQQALANRKAELEAKPNQIKQEMATINANIKAIDAQIKNIESDFGNQKLVKETELKKELMSIDLSLKEAQSQNKLLKLELEQIEKTLKDLEKQELEAKNKIKEVDLKVSELTSQLNETLDLIDLFGPKGFRSVCFDGLIERISQRAGQLFSIMTDGVYSTYLAQIGEDSKGASKLILKPVVTKGGQEVPMDDLSGGARRMAMLAYDVAISETVADSAPLFLDEALDGLDVVGKGEAMRLLESVAAIRPVYVIDHSSEFKSSFNQVLTVIHKNGESHLQEGA